MLRPGASAFVPIMPASANLNPSAPHFLPPSNPGLPPPIYPMRTLSALPLLPALPIPIIEPKIEEIITLDEFQDMVEDLPLMTLDAEELKPVMAAMRSLKFPYSGMYLIYPPLMNYYLEHHQTVSELHYELVFVITYCIEGSQDFNWI